LLSLAAGALSWGAFLMSCSGHPPETEIGFWVLPFSLVGAGLFLYLSSFFWKMRHVSQSTSAVLGLQLLLKKVIIFIASFVAVTLSFFIFSSLITYLVIHISVPDWALYVMYALETILAFIIGYISYWSLNKAMPNKTFKRDAKQHAPLN